MTDTISICTRFHFDKDSPNFQWRYEYYRDSVLPRILNQTDQNFIINIWCEPWHDELFKSLSERINIFRVNVKTEFPGGHLKDFARWDAITGLEPAKIQVGLDSDDLIESNFLEKVRELSYGNKNRLISFQPVKLSLNSGTKYRMKNYKSRRKCSPIFAMYQPVRIKYPYYRSHYRLPEDIRWKSIIYIPEGYCYMSIHDNNVSTKVTNRDKIYE